MNGGASHLVAPGEGAGPRRWRTPLIGVGVVLALVAGAAGFALLRDDEAPAGPAAAVTESQALATAAAGLQRAQTGTTLPPTTAPPTTMAPPTTVALDQPPGPFTGPTTVVPLAPGYAATVEVANATVATVSAYAEPLARPWPAAAAWTFPQSTLFGTPTAFLITGYAGPDWLKVMLPMKPNGTEGWVHRSEVTVTSTDERLIVDVESRLVQLFAGDRLLASSSAVVGKASTPTPTGTYFVTDLLRTDEPGGVYGPYILATSARSDAFDFFNGGEPIVALHGTNQPGLIGSAASNGCVRLPNEVSTQLASMTPIGTPVYII